MGMGAKLYIMMEKVSREENISKRAWGKVLQDLRSGETAIIDLPSPSCGMSLRVAASKLNSDPNCEMQYKVNVFFNESRAVISATRR
jgi:hypothetical protein